jgi:hypothetical protein
MTWVASVLGCTEGQAYTLAIGIVLTVVTVWAGVPATLVERVDDVSAPVAPPPSLVMPEGDAERTETVRSPLAPVPVRSSAPPPARAPNAGPQPGVASPAPSAPPAPASDLGPPRIAANVGRPGAPDGVAALTDGRILVATNNGGTRGANAPSEVIRFSPDGARERSVTIDGQQQARTSGLGGIVVDGARNVYTTDTATARIVRIDPAGSQRTYVEIPDIAACGLLASADACEEGARDDRPAPRGVAIEEDGTLLVADAGQAVVWRIDVSARPAPWKTFPDTDPPVAVATEDAGSVLVLVSRSLDVERAGRGVLHRFAVRADGSPGEGSVVTITEALSDPSGVAVGGAGEIVLTLSGQNAVVLLSADGKERDRLEAAEAEGRTGVPLDGPSGVVLAGRSAWVTNGSPRSNTEANWVVFEIQLSVGGA